MEARSSIGSGLQSVHARTPEKLDLSFPYMPNIGPEGTDAKITDAAHKSFKELLNKAATKLDITPALLKEVNWNNVKVPYKGLKPNAAKEVTLPVSIAGPKVCTPECDGTLVIKLNVCV